MDDEKHPLFEGPWGGVGIFFFLVSMAQRNKTLLGGLFGMVNSFEWYRAREAPYGRPLEACIILSNYNQPVLSILLVLVLPTAKVHEV